MNEAQENPTAVVKKKAPKKRETPSTEPRGHASGVPVWCAFSAIVPHGELIPHPKNAKKHPKKQVRRLAQIIRLNGWRWPVVVSRQSGFIVKGHGRLAAAKFLDIDVPIDVQDYESEEKERADRLADNRIAELGEWDWETLGEELEAVQESLDLPTEMAGFDLDEIEHALKKLNDGDDDEKPNNTEVLEVAIQCQDVEDQRTVLKEMIDAGYKARALKSKIKSQ